jgi:hypothetical protein
MAPDTTRRPFGVSRALWLAGVLWLIGLIMTLAFA